MRKFFTIAILALSFNSFGQVPTNGLVGYWPFNGNANDMSGTGNNGIVSGPTLCTDRFGNANSAYNFNGNDDIIATTLNLTNPNPFSIAIWFKTSQSGRLIMFTPFQTGVTNQWDRIIWVDASGSVTFYVYNGAQQLITSTCTYFDNKWHSAIGTLSSNGMKLYVDGTLAASNPSVTSAENTSGYWRFGSRYCNSPCQAPIAQLDDIRIYNRELNQAEVSAIYHENCNPPMPSVSNIHICLSGTVTITATGGTNYLWYNSPTSCNVIGTTASYTTLFLTTTDTFYVSNNNGACESVRNTVIAFVDTIQTVTINPIADYININASPVSLSGTPTGGTFSGAGVSGSLFHPSIAGLGLSHVIYTYNISACNNSASENVIVYDTTGIVCSDTVHIAVTDTLFINVTLTGINPPNNTNIIKIYPNPAHTFVIINTGNYSSINNYTIKIENTLGQTVYQTITNQQVFQVNVNSFGGYGTYFVKILDDLSNLITTRKIILY